jgi:hypothetical protein
MTHWKLEGEVGVEIINFIDDCSRAVLCSQVVKVATAADVVRLFFATAGLYGLPASVLSDTGPSTPPPTASRTRDWRSIWPRWASSSNTASPTIPRPKAKSSATTRR